MPEKLRARRTGTKSISERRTQSDGNCYIWHKSCVDFIDLKGIQAMQAVLLARSRYVFTYSYMNIA